MKPINKTESLWSKISMEQLEKREEYTALAKLCCWKVCCWNICCVHLDAPTM